MRTPSVSSPNRPSSLNATTLPAIVCNQPDDVAEVTALEGFRLLVRFNDGIQGQVDMSALVHSRNAGVFAQVADSDLFAQVFLEHGAVSWAGELDLAPDAMYAEIKSHGEWILS